MFKATVIKILTEHGRRMDGLSESFKKAIENKRKYQTEVKTELINTPEWFTADWMR